MRFDLADDVGTGAAGACVRVLPAPGCRRELGARDCLQRGVLRVPADPLGRVRRTRPSLPRRGRRKLAAGDVHGRRTRSVATRVACLPVGNEPAPARGARRRGRPPRSLHAARARSGSGVGRRVLHPRPGCAARAPPPPRTPRAARAASDDRSAARAAKYATSSATSRSSSCPIRRRDSSVPGLRRPCRSVPRDRAQR